MSNYTFKNKLQIILVVLACSVVSTSYAINKSNPTAHLDSVQKLVFSSSAAKQIIDSDVEEAKQKHQQARDLLEKGRQAIASGNQDQGKGYLSEAVKVMLQAVRLAEQKTVTTPKKQNDYSNRMETITALVKAFKRITDEKNDPASYERLNNNLQPILKNADKYKQAGNIDDARLELDKAYLVSKKSIEGIRGGDTLVRSLQFASKEEEYHYELDRNDTHNMLITILLKEKMKNHSIKRMVDPLIQHAGVLREKAIKLAEQGEYKTAVEELESSTKSLLRALRSAGIYIPG